MDSSWNRPGRSNRRANFQSSRRSLRQPYRPDDARSTHRSIARVLFVADERYRHDASGRLAWSAGGRHFWLDRAASNWADGERSHHSAALRRVQPLFLAPLPVRLSLLEIYQRARVVLCGNVDLPKIVAAIR